ncbi:MAG: DUF2520 domain-containing protein [Muribaculaceae bacterium]|nr:DUF2520 domain-containing protein [Muribaculaceae bacterium]MDE6644346.1 DUF2520 domain-containing protein [Muribaculaceae bacterium]
MVKNISSNDRPKIVMLGSGNVAGHLAIVLDQIGDVVQVYSPTLSHAEQLAGKLKNAVPVNNTNDIVDNVDFYIIAVKDDAIGELARKIKVDSGIWAHTSGSVPMSVFEGVKSHYGVFYLLQTFNKRDEVDFKNLPVLIEGNDCETEDALITLAVKISDKVKRTSSDDRAVIHRAAVFACNFSNYMWCIADDILKARGFDLKLLEPLLNATLKNALNSSPDNSQTGPARRGDRLVMEKHQSLLDKDQSEVYKLLSNQIFERFNSLKK